MATTLFRLPSARCAFALALLLGITLCCLPLVAVLGPESALILGLLLAPCACFMAVRLGLASPGVRTANLLVTSIGASWLLLALPLGLMALNTLRGQACDPWSGLAFIALGPLPSVTLAALVGACASTLGKPRLATAVALAVPLVSIARALYDFVSTPSIYAFGHLFGYFPGTLYDRQVDVPSAWLSHRVFTAVIAAGLWAFVVAARDPRSARLRPQRIAKHPLVAAWVALLAVVGALAARDSHALGHTTSSKHIGQQLGLVIRAPRCNVVVPRELERADAHRLAEECELRISQLEESLQVKESERITAFFFRSPQEKRALMGAARVYIAKPWRKEAYLQLAAFPHPVLGHELAHVVARRIATGPFGVPGKLKGLIPEPTLVEGLAVAFDPTNRDELTPDQWAKAAKAAKVAPPLRTLLGPSFLGHNQALAYTLAGSFLRYVHASYGIEKVRTIYRTGRVESTLQGSYQQLETRWESWLAAIPLPPHAAALAQLRFERPGVFSQVCPHQVEQLEGELGAALAAGDLARAERRCSQVLDIDPANSDARATYAGTLAKRGRVAAAVHQLKLLAGPPPAPSATLARARTLVADASYTRGDYDAALSSYRELLRAPQPEPDLRQLEVKIVGLEAGEPARGLIAELLIGRAGRAPDARTAMHLIQRLASTRRDGLAAYLEGRQLFSAGRFDFSLQLLRSSLAKGLPSRRLTLEAHRQAAVSAFAIGALDQAEAQIKAMSELPEPSLAEQAEARDLLQRVAFRRALMRKVGRGG